MCAIFGVIGENNPELIKKMSKVQEYRGPDKQNFLIEPNYNFCIGNNRLSVIDINNGHQPMESYDGNFTIEQLSTTKKQLLSMLEKKRAIPKAPTTTKNKKKNNKNNKNKNINNKKTNQNNKLFFFY